jgi:hypothetical protein
MELEQIKELLEFSKSLSDSDRKIAGNLLLNDNQEQAPKTQGHWDTIDSGCVTGW